MNTTTSSITDVLSGNKPVGVEVKLETKSLVMLGVVLIVAAVGILMFKKLIG